MKLKKYQQISSAVKGHDKGPTECPENSFAKVLTQAWSKADDRNSSSPSTQQLLAGALSLYEDASHQPSNLLLVT